MDAADGTERAFPLEPLDTSFLSMGVLANAVKFAKSNPETIRASASVGAWLFGLLVFGHGGLELAIEALGPVVSEDTTKHSPGFAVALCIYPIAVMFTERNDFLLLSAFFSLALMAPRVPLAAACGMLLLSMHTSCMFQFAVHNDKEIISWIVFVCLLFLSLIVSAAVGIDIFWKRCALAKSEKGELNSLGYLVFTFFLLLLVGVEWDLAHRPSRRKGSVRRGA